MDADLVLLLRSAQIEVNFCLFIVATDHGCMIANRTELDIILITDKFKKHNDIDV